MGNLFYSPTLWIRQPGRLLPDRASYEIFNADRQLLATAAETEARTRLKLLSKPAPDARTLSVATAAGESILTLIKRDRERMTELNSQAGEPAGQIRQTRLNRHYTLIDGHGQTVGKVVGDLALKHFAVAAPGGAEFARIRKTWAGLTKEMLTPSDHYRVDFATPVSEAVSTLTVMMAIVLDLTLYEPA